MPPFYSKISDEIEVDVQFYLTADWYEKSEMLTDLAECKTGLGERIASGAGFDGMRDIQFECKTLENANQLVEKFKEVASDWPEFSVTVRGTDDE